MNDPAMVEKCTLNNLRRATRALAKRYDAALSAVQLKSTQFSLLATLSKCQDITLTELADTLVMDRTTLSRNLKPLTAKGLIEINTATDKRIRTLRLSTEGKQLLEQALPLWESVQLTLVNDLGQPRWSHMITDLSEVLHLVQED